MSRRKVIEKLHSSFGKVKDDYFDFELIESYFKHKDHADALQVLSDKTCNDLDFQELFMFLDRTNSKPGQQYLYDQLRTIPENRADLDYTEALIIRLMDNVNLRKKTQLMLHRLRKPEAYYISSLFQEEHLKPPKWFFLTKVLSFASVFSLIMLPFNPLFLFILLGVFLINLGIHYWNKRNLYRYLGSIPQLLKLNGIAVKLHKMEEFRDIEPGLPEAVKVINQVRNRMSFFRLEAGIQGEFEALFWALLELVKIVFLLEPLLLFGVLRSLDNRRKEVERVFTFVGKIDALISIASLREGLTEYCLPELDDKRLEAEAVCHPLIYNCVPNSIRVEDRSILLTGSNMSGKTSFIRTIALNMITGLTINTCFARSFVLPPCRIYSAIRISDDLMNDRSYYFEEVLTVKEMIDRSKEATRNIFLLDEIFKGTNTIERISAGKAVLSCLNRNDNIVFVSTHDIELTDMLEDEYELYHFSEIVKENTVDFDYTLKEGKLKNRNAIRILQINDYPDTVIKEAIEISKSMDKKSS